MKIQTYFLAFFLFEVRFTFSDTTNQIICDGVVFLNQYYEKQMLFGSLNKPINLVAHKKSGTLFFSYTDKEHGWTEHRIMVCNIDERSCRTVQEVDGGHVIAYDRSNDNIYLGGCNGIYEYNFTTQSANFFGMRGRKIHGLFIQKHFYIIKKRSKKLFVYKNGKFVLVPESKNIQIDTFFVSKHFVMYFSNVTGLYRAERPGLPVTLLSKDVHIRQISQDYKDGSVFFVARDGIYTDATGKNKLVKVASIHSAFGLTFRRTTDSPYEPRQIIYSDARAIYRLMPSLHKDICLEQRTKLSVKVGTGYIT